MADVEQGIPQLDLTQEIRFGVVMYGGVSLAIYINGVAQELLNLVRATAPRFNLPQVPVQSARIAPDDLSGTERVYRKLGQMISRSGELVLDPADDAPIRTRFVVDLISGASAGGINGVMLAKALAIDATLKQLKNLWFEEADIGRLLNDKRSVAGIDLKLDDPPPSLLNGDRMLYRIIEALDGMDASAKSSDQTTSLVTELDLFVTATDLAGVVVPLKLADDVVEERTHGAEWRLRLQPPSAHGDFAYRNDFIKEHNSVLAFAARSTSAFPVAFEPVSVEDAIEIARRVDPKRTSTPSQERLIQQVFSRYIEAGDTVFRKRFYGDGGALDNSPFTALIELLRERRSSVPVSRKLIFVEPDPAHPRNVDDEPVRPGPIENAVKLGVSLPRVQTIREDLERVGRRNEAAAKAKRLINQVDEFYLQRAGEIPEDAPVDEWLERPLGDVSDRLAFDLKLQQSIDGLSGVLCRAAGLQPSSDLCLAVKVLVQAWVGSMKPRQQRQFLLDYNVEFRLRQIEFIKKRADELSDPDSSDAMKVMASGARSGALETDEGRAAYREALRAAKAGLSDAAIFLRRSWAALGAADGAVAAALNRLPLTRAELERILKGLATGEMATSRRAAELVQTPSVLEGIEAFNAELAAETQRIFAVADGVIEAAFALQPNAEEGRRFAIGLLDYYRRRYEPFDTAILPLMLSFDGEIETVDVLRVSPWDARSLIDERTTTRRKLAGTEVGHFGGFLDLRWRRNDLMWGRLDAAERLISTLLPGDDPRVTDARASLLREAQRAIVAEEFDAAGDVSDVIVRTLLDRPVEEREGEQDPRVPAMSDTERKNLVTRAVADRLNPDAIVEHLKTGYAVPRDLEAEASVRLAGRALNVIGKVLDGAAEDDKTKVPVAVVAKFTRLLSGLVRLALPVSYGDLIRYWMSAVLLFEVLLIAGGALLGVEAARSLGTTALILTLVVWLIVTVVRDLVRRESLRPKLLAAGGVLLVLFAAFAAGRWTDAVVIRPARWVCRSTVGTNWPSLCRATSPDAESGRSRPPARAR